MASQILKQLDNVTPQPTFMSCFLNCHSTHAATSCLKMRSGLSLSSRRRAWRITPSPLQSRLPPLPIIPWAPFSLHWPQKLVKTLARVASHRMEYLPHLLGYSVCNAWNRLEPPCKCTAAILQHSSYGLTGQWKGSCIDSYTSSWFFNVLENLCHSFQDTSMRYCCCACHGGSLSWP